MASAIFGSKQWGTPVDTGGTWSLNLAGRQANVLIIQDESTKCPKMH